MEHEKFGKEPAVEKAPNITLELVREKGKILDWLEKLSEDRGKVTERLTAAIRSGDAEEEVRIKQKFDEMTARINQGLGVLKYLNDKLAMDDYGRRLTDEVLDNFDKEGGDGAQS